MGGNGCDFTDFDCNGMTGPGDLALFATAWQKETGDSSIVVDACNLECPGGAAAAAEESLAWASRELIEAFGLPVPDADWAGWRLAPTGTEVPERTKKESRPRRGIRGRASR